MKLENLDRRLLEKILIAILLTSLLIHGVSLVLGRIVFEGWQWIQVPLHSSVEMIGAAVAFAVAFLLVTLEDRAEGTSYNIRIAGALVGMGLFDGFHAMVHSGSTFVWLHSLSMFIGGLLFALVWLPHGLLERIDPIWPYWTALGTSLLATLSVWYPNRIPSMLVSNNFSTAATVMNVTGGFLLLGASLKLMITFRAEKKVDDLLFSLHCLLFGAAGIMFEQSTLWDFSWWGWHFLRLLAYGAALVFAVDTFLRDQRDLKQHKNTLERKVRERTKKLEKTLREKETLLKEIHHRVKNNMQVISSMLSLQASQFEESTVRESFDESLSRIHSMALVHDLLYQSDDLAELDFRNYVRQLMDELKGTLVSDQRDITIETEVEDVSFSVDTAVRCGLIVNELVTNSLQHAFNGDESGRVQLTVEGLDDGYRLTVEDNGSGFEARRDRKTGDSLGIELVEALVTTDLSGDMTVTGEEGTTVTIEFQPPENLP